MKFVSFHVSVVIVNHCKSRLPLRLVTRDTDSYYNVYLLQCSVDIMFCDFCCCCLCVCVCDMGVFFCSFSFICSLLLFAVLLFFLNYYTVAVVPYR